jgi:myo-inositol-1-phosphate synthase
MAKKANYVQRLNVYDSKNNDFFTKDVMHTFCTDRKRKTGVLLVGAAGNNGSTFKACLLANQGQLQWYTKHGVCKANFLGSLSQHGAIAVAKDSKTSKPVYKTFRELIDVIDPCELCVDGWDITDDTLQNAVAKAEVLDFDLQQKLQEKFPKQMQIKPMRGIFYPDFVATNQIERASNAWPGEHACLEHLNTLRKDIRSFKQKNKLEHVVVLWTANTERFMDITKGVHDTAENLMKAICDQNVEISPSLMYAVAAVSEGATFLNGSPQNTLVPGLIDLAKKNNTHLGGNDFKSGQTKFKSAMVDYLVASGFKPKSVVSYNHLGNNDGLNLKEEKQFVSKKISKTKLIDNILAKNPSIKANPDHEVVIKYVPHVKDDKRAWDEYVAEIFMGGEQIMSTYTICPDSLLAVPIMIDLIVFAEWMSRMSIDRKPLPTVLSYLSFFFKSPSTNEDIEENVPNAFVDQRNALSQLAMASVGLEVFNPLF